MSLGMIGKKLGMTQVNDSEGARVAVTLLEIGPCLVMRKKTVEKDGYDAVALAYGAKKAKRTSKAMMGIFGKLKSDPKRMIREFRVSSAELGTFNEGEMITLDKLFTAGQWVDVSGRTKGRGFTGVMKRWNMKGFRASHGTHEFFRHGGSIGTRTWPGHVHKNKRMGGHYGDENVSTQSLRVVQVMLETNRIAVEGSVPGAANGFIVISPAVKRPAPKA